MNTLCTLIFGRLQVYYKHNSNFQDYLQMAYLLAQHIIDWGWKWVTMHKFFTDAHFQILGQKIKLNKIDKK